jgi:NAD-dependent deacetylase
MSTSDCERAARMLLDSQHAICLTGAGLSVESGIPPFRGPGGIWTKHGEPPMDGYQRFLHDPASEWRQHLNPEGPMKAFAETLLSAQPNDGHRALAELEALGVLRCLITQNVDNLHLAAGQREVLEIHGNVKLVRCLDCSKRWPRDAIEVDPENLPPRCDECGGIIKSDAVQFGEPIPPKVLARCMEEGQLADCCIVAGTSATVYPAAQIPLDVLHRGGRLIEVNLYDSEITPYCELTLQGPAAVTLSELVSCVRSMQSLEKR